MSIEPAVQVVVEEWLADVDAFFTQVEFWISEITPPLLVERRTLRLVEGLSGPYETEELVLTSGIDEVRLCPRARWVVGADGRIDLLGIEGPMIFVLIRERGGWFYLADRPSMDMRPLDGPLFLRLLMSNFR